MCSQSTDLSLESGAFLYLIDTQVIMKWFNNQTHKKNISHFLVWSDIRTEKPWEELFFKTTLKIRRKSGYLEMEQRNGWVTQGLC